MKNRRGRNDSIRVKIVKRIANGCSILSRRRRAKEGSEGGLTAVKLRKLTAISNGEGSAERFRKNFGTYSSWTKNNQPPMNSVSILILRKETLFQEDSNGNIVNVVEGNNSVISSHLTLSKKIISSNNIPRTVFFKSLLLLF